MTREEWKKRYDTDPAFRLERLLILHRRNYRKHGRTHPGAYERHIERAKAELKAPATQETQP